MILDQTKGMNQMCLSIIKNASKVNKPFEKIEKQGNRRIPFHRGLDDIFMGVWGGGGVLGLIHNLENKMFIFKPHFFLKIFPENVFFLAY